MCYQHREVCLFSSVEKVQGEKIHICSVKCTVTQWKGVSETFLLMRRSNYTTEFCTLRFLCIHPQRKILRNVTNWYTFYEESYVCLLLTQPQCSDGDWDGMFGMSANYCKGGGCSENPPLPLPEQSQYSAYIGWVGIYALDVKRHKVTHSVAHAAPLLKAKIYAAITVN